MSNYSPIKSHDSKERRCRCIQHSAQDEHLEMHESSLQSQPCQSGLQPFWLELHLAPLEVNGNTSLPLSGLHLYAVVCFIWVIFHLAWSLNFASASPSLAHGPSLEISSCSPNRLPHPLIPLPCLAFRHRMMQSLNYIEQSMPLAPPHHKPTTYLCDGNFISSDHNKLP